MYAPLKVEYIIKETSNTGNGIGIIEYNQIKIRRYASICRQRKCKTVGYTMTFTASGLI